MNPKYIVVAGTDTATIRKFENLTDAYKEWQKNPAGSYIARIIDVIIKEK